jgi:hypothetical protein
LDWANSNGANTNIPTANTDRMVMRFIVPQFLLSMGTAA